MAAPNRGELVRRKRVLVVTYYWPPSGGSGVQRWLKFSRYLPEFGWDATVVTPENPDFPVRDESLLAEVGPDTEVIRLPIWEPYAAYRQLTGAKPGENFGAGPDKSPSLLKRFSTWVRANFFVPDPRVYWVRPTVKAIAEYLTRASVDAIVTTGPPHSVHLIGLGLKRRFPALPWILDVRDPWSQFDVHLAFGPGARARAENERLERTCLAAADVVLGTAPSMPDSLEPFDSSKYRCVTNGYDESDFPEVQAASAKTTGRFHLYHTGLLNAVRNPVAVWEALGRMCAHDARFAERLHVYLIGTVAGEVRRSLADQPGLRGRWTIEPWMDHATLLGRYADADAFLLCPNRSDNARSQINGKLFEYLAMRRPILHVGPFDSDNTRLLDEAHAGLTVMPGDRQGMIGALEQLSGGRFNASEHAFSDRVIRRFSRRATAEQLSGVLGSVTRGPS